MEKTNPIMETALSGTWTFTPENGAPAQITVANGGGWLKQGFDCEAGTYETRIAIPDFEQSFTAKLEIGAVNHHAEYYIGESAGSMVKIHEEVTAFTPQTVDLSAHVKPGREYILRIFVRAYKGGRPVAPHWAEWSECVARGLFRDAFLRFFPEVRISDIFVKTSVAERRFVCDVWVENSSAHDKPVALGGAFSSWNMFNFAYPEIAMQNIL